LILGPKAGTVYQLPHLVPKYAGSPFARQALPQSARITVLRWYSGITVTGDWIAVTDSVTITVTGYQLPKLAPGATFGRNNYTIDILSP
jgi:hypothetical protein